MELSSVGVFPACTRTIFISESNSLIINRQLITNWWRCHKLDDCVLFHRIVKKKIVIIEWIAPLHGIPRREYSIHYCGNVCRTYEPALYRQCLSVCMQKVVLSFLRHFLVRTVVTFLCPLSNAQCPLNKIPQRQSQITGAGHCETILANLLNLIF